MRASGLPFIINLLDHCLVLRRTTAVQSEIYEETINRYLLVKDKEKKNMFTILTCDENETASHRIVCLIHFYLTAEGILNSSTATFFCQILPEGTTIAFGD